MLIRTQDKMGVVEISGIKIKAEVRTSGCVISAYANQYPSCYPYEELGEYDTRERAIEVIDDITKTYTRVKQAQVIGSECTSIPKFVYEMPER